MVPNLVWPDRWTPTLLVSDPRSRPIRSIAYCRSTIGQPADERITRQRFDGAGRFVASRDPRLTSDNLTTVNSLSGKPLLTENVDAGWRLSLWSEAGKVLTHWDSRGTEQQTVFDELQRQISISEQSEVVERFTYGQTGASNQAGRLIRHDHPGGTRLIPDYGLSGLPLVETRLFLTALQSPNWPEALDDRDQMLEADCYTDHSVFNSVGDVIAHTDAKNNTRHFMHTLAGELKSVSLMLANKSTHLIVSDIRYTARGQIERETAGNGIITQSIYGAADGRLINKSAGSLQNLSYDYDPIGNILSIKDTAHPTTHFRNQRIDPINHYRYDSLYQLIEATGREVTSAQFGSPLPSLQPTPLDPHQLVNYTQNFEYDAAGNLQVMQHISPNATSYSQKMTTSQHSNRSLLLVNDHCPSEQEIFDSFDANGNLKELQRGQTMTWNVRNQLQQINNVVREDAPNDSEVYLYDDTGQRVRKVRITQVADRTRLAETYYLPGLEIHRNTATGEVFHVIRVEAAGCSVRALHWDTPPPTGISNDQVRYSLGDHLGSCTLELDDQADLISQEGYYPFGGTAWWAGRSAVQAKYKTIRYSGKERDATGLYYYGLRYYAPWLKRWINPDPAGDIDGLNRFVMVNNNPINFYDANGLQKYKGKHDLLEISVTMDRGKILARGLSKIKEKAPEAGEGLQRALDYAKIATSEASGMLEKNNLSDNQSKLAVRIFGTRAHDESVKADLQARVKIINNAVHDYISKSSEQIVAIKSNKPSELAFTIKKDNKERIFFTEAGLKQSSHDIAKTFVHEISHRVLDTEDFHYYGKGHHINPEDMSTGNLEADRVSQGKEDERLAKYTSENVPKKAATGIFGTHDKTGILATMEANPLTRSNALLNNADSIALYIFGLAHARIQRAQMGINS